MHASLLPSHLLGARLVALFVPQSLARLRAGSAVADDALGCIPPLTGRSSGRSEPRASVISRAGLARDRGSTVGVELMPPNTRRPRIKRTPIVDFSLLAGEGSGFLNGLWAHGSEQQAWTHGDPADPGRGALQAGHGLDARIGLVRNCLRHLFCM